MKHNNSSSKDINLSKLSNIREIRQHFDIGESLSETDRKYYSPLFKTIMVGNVFATDYFLKQGSDPNQLNKVHHYFLNL